LADATPVSLSFPQVASADGVQPGPDSDHRSRLAPSFLIRFPPPVRFPFIR
jgi:hypothetical protein